MYFYICINNNIATNTNIVMTLFFLINIVFFFFISTHPFIFDLKLWRRRKIYLNPFKKLEMFTCIE